MATTAQVAGAWSAGLAGAIGVAALLAWRRLRGTTLSPAALWTATAAAAVAAVEIRLAISGAGDSLGASLARYAAAVGALCPMMAVLGAKRPQDRAWQWVVAALWAVLLAPVGQALAAPAGSRLELFAAWRLALAALLSLQILNYLPTRHALAAILATFGQAGILAPQLLGAAENTTAEWRTGGLAAIALAVLLAWRPPRRDGLAPNDDLTRRWLDFRDNWGAFWALRVLQRLGQSADAGAWSVRLQWPGFVPAPPDDADRARVAMALDAQLGRFDRTRATAPARGSGG